MPPKKLTSELTITTECSNPVQLLAEDTGLSTQKIKQAMQKGAVWSQRKQAVKRTRRFNRNLAPGDKLFLYYDERVLQQDAPPPQLIEDCQSYSVWFKPYGVLCQGSKWGDHTTINRLVELELDRPSMLIHRLDRATSGLIVLGHTKKSTAAIAAQFEGRQIKKYYQAKVEGRLERTVTIDVPVDGKQAHSVITPLGYDAEKDMSLIQIDIATGRKHQIRKHCQHLGFPIVGDRLYGTAKHQEDLQLSATGLAFNCPIDNTWRSYQLPQKLRLQF